MYIGTPVELLWATLTIRDNLSKKLHVSSQSAIVRILSKEINSLKRPLVLFANNDISDHLQNALIL